jgi:hypothetical protein
VLSLISSWFSMVKPPFLSSVDTLLFWADKG